MIELSVNLAVLATQRERVLKSGVTKSAANQACRVDRCGMRVRCNSQQFFADNRDIVNRRTPATSVAGRVADHHTGGGSIRSIVFIRSMDRSKDTTLLTPVLSAQATRYASAKSIRSVS